MTPETWTGERPEPRLVDSWTAGALTPWVYRLTETSGEYLLEVRGADEPETAWRPCVKGDGHKIARRIAELLRETDLVRNVVELKAREA